jgi:phage tail-like protein
MAENGDTFVTHRFQVELGKARVESVQEVNGLTVELDAIEVNQVTPTGEYIIRKIPGARKGGEVTIIRGLDKSSAFTDWIKDTFEKGAIGAARQNISVMIVDSENQSQRRFDLTNAWVSKWEGPSLKAGDASPATETVTIVFEDITSS